MLHTEAETADTGMIQCNIQTEVGQDSSTREYKTHSPKYFWALQKLHTYVFEHIRRSRSILGRISERTLAEACRSRKAVFESPHPAGPISAPMHILGGKPCTLSAATPISLCVLLPHCRWYKLGPVATTDSHLPAPTKLLHLSDALLDQAIQWYSVGHVIHVHLSTCFRNTTKKPNKIT